MDRLSMPIPYEASNCGVEMVSEDNHSAEEVVSDGEATVKMIRDFVERLPHEDQRYNDSFDDSALLMKGVSGEAGLRTDKAEQALEPTEYGRISDGESTEGQQDILRSYGDYKTLDEESWTEESALKEDEGFDTSMEDEDDFAIATTRNDMIEAHDVGRGDYDDHDGWHHQVLDDIQSQKEESGKSIHDMTEKTSWSGGHFSRDVMVEYDKTVAGTSDDESEAAVHENECEVDPETFPSEENGQYDDMMSTDDTHGESIIFVEEEAHGHGLFYEEQIVKPDHIQGNSQASREWATEEIAGYAGPTAVTSLGKMTRDGKLFEHDVFACGSCIDTNAAVNVERDAAEASARYNAEAASGISERTMVAEEQSKSQVGLIPQYYYVIDDKALGVGRGQLLGTSHKDEFESINDARGGAILVDDMSDGYNQTPCGLGYSYDADETNCNKADIDETAFTNAAVRADSTCAAHSGNTPVVAEEYHDPGTPESFSKERGGARTMSEESLDENDVLPHKRKFYPFTLGDCAGHAQHLYEGGSTKESTEGMEKRQSDTTEHDHFRGRIVSAMADCENTSTEEFILEPGTIPRDENDWDTASVDDKVSLDEVFVGGTFKHTRIAHVHEDIEKCSSRLYETEGEERNCSEAPSDGEPFVSTSDRTGNGSYLHDALSKMKDIPLIEQSIHGYIETLRQRDPSAAPEPPKRIGYRRTLTLEELAASSRTAGKLQNIVESNKTSEVLAIKKDSRCAARSDEIENPATVSEPQKRIGYRRKHDETENLVVWEEKDSCQNSNIGLPSHELDKGRGVYCNPIVVKETVHQAENEDNLEQNSTAIQPAAGPVGSVSRSNDSVEETFPEVTKSTGKQLEACIEAFGYYLEQRQINNNERDSFLKAVPKQSSEESGIYRAVPWTEDPAVDGQIIVRREDISRVPSSLLGHFCRGDGVIRSDAVDRTPLKEDDSNKSEGASIYTDPDEDVPTPLVKRANTIDRLGTSLVLPMGMNDDEEENELEYSVNAESLGMEGVEDAIAESHLSGNDHRARKTVSWDEFARVKSDDPCLKSGPLKLNDEFQVSGRKVRCRRKKEVKKASGCDRLCGVFHEAPYWTKVLVYVSITMFCIAFGILFTALLASKKKSDNLTPTLRVTPVPTTVSPTMAPSISYDLEPPQNVTVDVDPTVKPNINATVAPIEMDNITVVSDATVSAPPSAAPTTVEVPASYPTASPTVSTPTTTSPPVTSPASTNRPPFLWG